MIYYDQIADLPKNHPLYIAFLEQLKQEDLMYEELGQGVNPIKDETSYAYFNRFIAGDR